MNNLTKKVKRHYKNTWVGYLTPTEILTLVENGIKPEPTSIYMVEWAKESQEKGLSNPSWFYFIYNKKSFEKLNIRSDPHNRVNKT